MSDTNTKKKQVFKISISHKDPEKEKEAANMVIDLIKSLADIFDEEVEIIKE